MTLGALLSLQLWSKVNPYIEEFSEGFSEGSIKVQKRLTLAKTCRRSNAGRLSPDFSQAWIASLVVVHKEVVQS